MSGKHPNGLTEQQQALWERRYNAIKNELRQALQDAPTADEARRRIGIVRLEIAVLESALDAHMRRRGQRQPSRHLSERALEGAEGRTFGETERVCSTSSLSVFGRRGACAGAGQSPG